MLKQRLLTAIILIPIFILLVLKLSSAAFCLFVSAVVIWGAWEWSLFMGVATFPQCFFYPASMLVLLIGLVVIPIPIAVFLYVGCGWWIVAFMLVSTYPRTTFLWGKNILLRAVMGLLVLIPCWLSINFIRQDENGIFKLLFLFVLIWGADSGAYFVGRKWGKQKLAPSVSPGKTWQGLLGALITAIVITLGAFLLFDVPKSLWLGATLLSIVTVLFSILGDLFESMLKRNVGLKDSGHALPGHGGILDRIDSLTAAAPIFALGLFWMREIFH